MFARVSAAAEERNQGLEPETIDRLNAIRAHR
jgi:hypothetical protein